MAAKGSFPTVSSTKPDLWKEAYANIKKDPDDCEIYNDFREIINKQSGRAVNDRLSSESGRKYLLSLIESHEVSMEARSKTSPKVQQALNIVGKARSLITLGAAANPISTVAVAGLFVIFDMQTMYAQSSQAMLNIALDVGDIVCRTGVESRESYVQERNEPQALIELRERLRGAYVQLYRTLLIVTMKLVRMLNSKFQMFLRGWYDRPGEQQNLAKMEARVAKFLESIAHWRINKPAAPPNWRLTQRNELHNAARYGHTSEVYRLINSGKCVPSELNAKTARGWTPLMFATEDGHYDIMDMLLETKGLDVNIQNLSGHTALDLAALKNRVHMMRRLLQHGAKVDTWDAQGRTTFVWIATPGYLEAMKLLKAAGADLNQVTRRAGYSALHGAVDGDQLEVVQWLLKQGIDKEIKITGGRYQGMTAKEMAQALGRAEIQNLLT